MDFVVYSHSDFFDILPIQLEYVDKNIKDIYNVHLFLDKPISNTDFNIVLYDEKLPYASRILSCLNHINSEYILITHENDILLKIDNNIIDKLVSLMKVHTIDSLELKQGINICDPIKVTDSLVLSRKNTGYIFSVQPTIWKRNSLIELFSTFSSKTYRTIECDEVNKYILSNFKSYITFTFNPIKTIWYHVTEHYMFIHLTSRLLFLPCSKSNNLYHEIQKEHEYITQKYLSNATRGFQPSLYSFLSHMVKDHTWN